MKKTFTSSLIILSLLFGSTTKAQDAMFQVLNAVQQVFDIDSLKGFDEAQASKTSIAEDFLGAEFKIHMSQLKRAYINAKYNVRYSFNDNNSFKGNIPAVQASACLNEDFEASAAGNITVSGQILGWTINRGTNNSGSNSCNLSGCCTSQPNDADLYSAPGGLVDPIIGASYPIFSVFGSGAQNPGTGTNPQLTNGCYGNNFIRINGTGIADFSMHKLTKTIAVTAANNILKLAFISVMSPSGHQCCDASAIKVLLKDGCGSFSVMTCPSFSAGASGSCGSSVNYLPAANAQYQYNKWQQMTIDLSSKVGCNITVEVIATDCTAGGHFGYAYVDAQCGTMDLVSGNNSFPLTPSKITVATCGSPGANLTAPNDMGSYQWQGPGSWIANPSFTAQTVVNVPGGTYTLTMNPPGVCGPITRTIVVVNTPSPSIGIFTLTQVSCTNPTSKASATLVGSATIIGTTVLWTPTPASSVHIGAVTSATNLVAGSNSLIVTDTAGCRAIIAFTVNPAPVIPTVAIGFSPTNTLTCAIPNINLTASSIPANLTYSWTSACGSNTGAVISVNQPCTYTVFCTDQISGCTATNTITIFQDISVATASITPGNQALACGSAPVTYTGSPAPLANYSYQWYTPCGPILSGYVCSPGCVGVYTFEVTNTLNGCKSTKTVTVTANSNIPSMTITAQANNYYVTCVNCVTLQISASVTGTCGIGLGWMNASGTATLTTSNTLSTCIPGNYIPFAYNLCAPNCSVTQMLTVLSNTASPTAGFSSSVWGSQSPTLTCYNPCATLTGTSTSTSYSVGWENPSAINSPTLSVCSTTNTAQTTVGTPSVVITDLTNGCVKKLAVPVYQDIKTVGLTAKSTPSVLTCKILQSALSFTPSPITASFTFTWTTPPPGVSVPQINPIYVYAPGVYTIEVTSSFNGCKSFATVNVGLNNVPPATVPVPDATLSCGSNTTLVSSGVTSTVGNTYNWVEGPAGASINPVTGESASVNKVGIYMVVITNTITGCSSINTVQVVPDAGGIISITASKNPICLGDSSVLTITSAPNTPTWSTGSNSMTITVKPTTTTLYTVSAGTTTNNCQTYGAITVSVACVGINEMAGAVIEYGLFPNPNNGAFNLQINDAIENAELQIVNNLGQMVYRKNVVQGSNSIEVTQLAKGLYHFVLLQNNEPQGRGKLLIE